MLTLCHKLFLWTVFASQVAYHAVEHTVKFVGNLRTLLHQVKQEDKEDVKKLNSWEKLTLTKQY